MEIPVGIYEEITGLEHLPPPVDEADYERRKHRRIPFGCRAIIIPEQRKGVDAAPSVVMVRDMSEGGFSFLHTDAIKPGTPFVAEFKGHEERPVKLRCTVVRCDPGGSGGVQFVLGSSFDELLTAELPREQIKSLQPKSILAEPAAPIASDPLLSAADQSRPADGSNKPASEQPNVAASAPTPPKSSNLFKFSDSPPPKKNADEYWSEAKPDAVAAVPTPVPVPAPSAVAPVSDGPVFRVVPLPEPEKAAAVALELGPQESDAEVHEEKAPVIASHEPSPVVETPETAATARKHHEVLARVKELLVKQERVINSQKQELKEQRERWEKQMESMRLELNATKQDLADLRNRANADDNDIAELESFLKQHGAGEQPQRGSEAA